MAGMIDLNSDMGESFGAWSMGSDGEMLKIVSSANVACGFHAGDPLVMHETATLAKANGVDIGAHPSFLDLWGFGRRAIQGEDPRDVEKMIIYQIGALEAVARAAGHKVTHVKTHGSLGNMSAVEPALADAVARAIKTVDPGLVMVVMPGLETERAGLAAGLRVAREIYADRLYDENGNLASRKKPGTVLHDPALAARRVLAMIEEGAITTMGGKKLKVKIDTVCVHGDNPEAVQMARAVRAALEAAGFQIRPFSTFVN
jgi:UPF0271 protein